MKCSKPGYLTDRSTLRAARLWIAGFKVAASEQTTEDEEEVEGPKGAAGKKKRGAKRKPSPSPDLEEPSVKHSHKRQVQTCYHLEGWDYRVNGVGLGGMWCCYLYCR